MATVTITLVDNEEDNAVNTHFKSEPELTPEQMEAGEVTAAQAIALVILDDLIAVGEELAAIEAEGVADGDTDNGR